MKTHWLLYLLSTAFFIAGARAQDCTPAHPFTTVNPGKLTVATAYYPPFDEVDDNGVYRGLEADVLRWFAQRECLELKADSVGFAATTQSVLSKRADIVAGVYYRSKARAEVMGTADPVFVELMAIYSKTGSDSLAKLEGKRVGTVQNYYWVKDLRNVYGRHLKLYPTPAAALADLQSGRLDAVIDAYTAGAYAQQQGALPDIKIIISDVDSRVPTSARHAQSSFLYHKDNSALGEALNAAIAELHKSGKLIEIIKKYGVSEALANVGEPRYVDDD